MKSFSWFFYVPGPVRECGLNIKDVARMAGVSISTVSRVINSSAYVSPEIRRAVEAILTETGYRPNSLAKELLRNKTNTIGVMLPRIDLGTFAAMFDGIVHVLNENGYNVMLANTRDELDEELRYMDLFNEKRVDGILFFGTGESPRYRPAISKLRTPVVIVGQTGAYMGCSSVLLDSFNAARAMVNYLIGLGHRRIGCLAVADHDVNVGMQRKQGYQAALADNGIAFDPALLAVGTFEYLSGEVGARSLMESAGGAPTAIYTVTDRLAVSVAGWLQRNGYRVPDDVSVACVDDPELLSYCYPSITTMSFDYRLTGMNAGQLLIDCIEGAQDDIAEVVMPYTLQVRGSTRALESGS
jgi:DNA-binding LacI/PurR family transcriptional regulator